MRAHFVGTGETSGEADVRGLRNNSDLLATLSPKEIIRGGLATSRTAGQDTATTPIGFAESVIARDANKLEE